MLFNSFEYILFLPLIFIFYWLIPSSKRSYQNILLLIGSYIFYGWWSWKFLILLFGSTLLDYMYGFGVSSDNQKKSKTFLWLSIINNLGILAIFKYYNFFIDQFLFVFNSIGIHLTGQYLNVVIPVGISFYTFHGMSYVFDIYNKKRKPVINFIDYSLFVSFFPLLVAGPIERANHLLPQIQNKRVFSYAQAISGSKLILWGLFKKIVIADNLAIIADKYFDTPFSYDSFSLIIGVVAFSFQIYCDFSGYSDIALGSAKLLGFELLSNFKFPYFSRDIAEFWRRWHISLSSWFRDYLYIPLGGSQKGKLIATRNTFIIFLVSGFWHGASWNFIIWGLLHAIFFIPYLLLSKNRNNVNTIVASDKIFPSISESTKILFTFLLVCFAWIFFRAENLNDSIIYIKHLCFDAFDNPSQFLRIGQHFIYPHKNLSILWIIPLLIVEWRFRYNERNLFFSNNNKINISFYFIISILILNCLLHSLNKEPSGFIYFQF